MQIDFENKLVLVTGASRGIGKAIALAFKESNAKVIGTATSESGANAISEYLDGSGKGYVMNSLDNQSMLDLIKSINDDFNAMPDILVNNAGITKDTLFLRMKENDWNDVINCNLNAVAFLTKQCMSAMSKKRFGRIINITSITGQIGNAGQCNYAAAKAGLIGFTRSLAMELGSRQVTVNCVSPGFIETDMTSVLSEEQIKEWCKNIPLKRAGLASEVADAVVFLASDKASYITGSTIDVNGGLYRN